MHSQHFRAAKTEAALAWLVPLHPFFGLIALIVLSLRSHAIWPELRTQRGDLAAWGLLGAAGLISVVLGYNLTQGLVNWFGPFLFIWVYCLGRWTIVDPEGFLRAMLRGTALLGSLLVIGKILQLDIHIAGFPLLTDFTGEMPRSVVLGVWGNGLAVILEAAAVGGLALLSTSKSWKGRVEAAAIAALALLGVFITLSRGAMLGVAAGVVTAGLLFTPWVLLPVTGVAGLLAWLSPLVRQRIISIMDLTTDVSNVGRLNIWEGALKLIRDHPWFGVGPGNFHEVYQSYSVPGFEHFLTPHSTYLTMLAGWGIVGAVLFFGWIAWVVLRAWRRGLSPLQKVMVVIMAAFWTHVLVDDLMAVYVPLLLGLLENRRSGPAAG